MCFTISLYLRDTKRWCLESPRFFGNIVLPLKQCRASASLQKCYHFRFKGRRGWKSGMFCEFGDRIVEDHIFRCDFVQLSVFEAL